MAKAAAQTGTGPTVTVAIEQHYPPDQRIIEDDLARTILPFPMRLLVSLVRTPVLRDWFVGSLEKSAPGIWAGVVCRKRYIDDHILEQVDKQEAVVNLGAGFDTRAYRLSAMRNTRVWEVDQPEIIERKRARLHALFGEVPGHVELVPMDFDHEDLDVVLSEHGYVPAMRTFFIVEAVTQYLTQAGMTALFRYMGDATPGSRLVFTYVLRDFIEGENLHGQKAAYDKWVVKEKAWLTGRDPAEIPELLGRWGWEMLEDLDGGELLARYGKAARGNLSSIGLERTVYAEKRKGR